MKTEGQAYLEKGEKSGLLTDQNREAFLAVAKMLDMPLTLEQVKEQIRKGNKMKAQQAYSRRTEFVQDGDNVIRKVYVTQPNGKEELYLESTHSIESLNKTVEEMIEMRDGTRFTVDDFGDHLK